QTRVSLSNQPLKPNPQTSPSNLPLKFAPQSKPSKRHPLKNFDYPKKRLITNPFCCFVKL
ncbi:MAG: hypothetical protein UD035_00465, partial [Coprococcus comes]|nr:hypothetical protein [Coprococcus comes]